MLITVAFGSMLIGVLFPEFAGLFTLCAVPGMMTILFLSFLSVELTSLYQLSKPVLIEVSVWTLGKLIFVPVIMWLCAKWLITDWAAAVLVLSATSTAAIAPFFTARLKGNVVLAIQAVVTTSLLTPLVMPAIIELFLGRKIHIPIFEMARLLALLIFLPLSTTLLFRRLAPRLTKILNRRRFIIIVFTFSIVMMGVFAQYSEFLISKKQEVLHAILIASALTVACILLGFVIGLLSRGRLEVITGVVILSYTNDMLAVVFGSQFFGPRIPLLASLHMLPLFLVLIPLEWLKKASLACLRKTGETQ